MKRIPQEFIDDLLNRLDIVEIIDDRVKLKKTGKNYSACCPFHNEKTPSFTVSPDKQFYYCFGCGATGTSLGFVMEYDRLGFREAVESLAKVAGVEVPKEDDRISESRRELNNLFSILEKANNYYQLQLREHPASKEAITYLKQRGLTGRIAKDFEIGFAPPGWDNLLGKLALNDRDRDLLVEAGLAIVNEEKSKCYDRFRQRIMFPISDIRGRIIGFGGRIIDSGAPATIDHKPAKKAGPKYLNSPETPIFHKGRELYGLHQAKRANRNLEHLLVVEGYMDVIALAQFEIKTAVATLGTACGEEHLKLAFRFTNQIVFCFDGDNAGRKAAKRALENSLPTMTDGRQIKFLFLPEGQDPDTHVRQIGKERFMEQVEQAPPLEDFFFESLSEGINSQTMEGRARLSKLAAPLLNKLPRGVFRELMFDMLSRRTGLSLDILQELMNEPVDPTEEKKTPTNEQYIDKPSNAVSASINQSQLAPAPQYAEETYSTKDEAYTEEIQPARALHPLKASNKDIRLPAAKLAATLLLEHPELINSLENTELPEQTSDENIEQLRQLVNYLRSRPQASFHSILGYWGGTYGMDSQRQLTELVANQFLGSAKKSETYNSGQELQDAFNTILRESKKSTQQLELQRRTAVSADEFSSMTEEQKKQILALLSLPHDA